MNNEKVTMADVLIPRPIDEYHEDMGSVLWWKFPLAEEPYVGTPNDLGHVVEVTIGIVDGGQKLTQMVGGWPGYHTHFTKIITPDAPSSDKNGMEAKP